jgi:4-amino-4-deoxy-L-arabinose transferase-like glycosyltransferase
VSVTHADEKPIRKRKTDPKQPSGAGWFLFGGLGTALLMMLDRQLGFGVPLGIVLMGFCVWGALDRLGLFGAPQQVGSLVVAAAPSCKRWAAALSGAMIFLVGTVVAASRGVLPGRGLVAGVLVTASLLSAVGSAYGLVDALGVFADERMSSPIKRLLSHPSLWLLSLAVLLYVPFLGNFGLIDPWETHYGEVSREILARDDWMSLWWAQDGWFNSKPIFDFWIQALAFASLGVNFHPDGFVSAVGHGLWPQPEWAARLPMVFFALVAHAVLYAGVKIGWGRRAAFLGSVVWLTTPFWYLIVHQTMTDLPYIAPLAAAMGLFLLGFGTDPDQKVSYYRVQLHRRKLYFSGAGIVVAMLLVCTLPQIFYLISRNITLITQHAPHGFNWHWDEFFAGSGGGNCGLPGNEECHRAAPVNLHPQPLVSALLWTLLLGFILYIHRNERRKQRLYFLAAWILLAISALAKELPGVLIAVGALGAFLFATNRWDLVKRLELPSALLLFVVIAVPWYLQETVRHGSPFLERLLVHDMYKRAFVHVHDTNAGDDVSFRYYIWQLGYGLFPASGLCAIGVLHWIQSRSKPYDLRRATGSFLFIWSLVAFGMFTLTLTKFHHYIIPIVPPLAMLTGPVLHQALWRTEWPKGRQAILYASGCVAAALALLVGITRVVPIARATQAHNVKLGLVLIVGALALLVWTVRKLPSGKHMAPPAGKGLTLAVLGVGAVLATLLVGRDLFTSLPGDVVGPMRLIHLVCYNYSRPWPETLHFEPVMVAFTVAAALGLLGLVVGGKARPHGVVFFLIVACLWTGWGLDQYLVKIAPHWSQRETIIEYYKRRKSPDEWLVAYQMNWKGENIYTGNHLATFVATGEKFKSWIDERRKSNHPVVFVTAEHSRISALKSEIGQLKQFDVITDKTLNNKFALVRVAL